MMLQSKHESKVGAYALRRALMQSGVKAWVSVEERDGRRLYLCNWHSGNPPHRPEKSVDRARRGA